MRPVPNGYKFRAGDVIVVEAVVRFGLEPNEDEDQIHIRLNEYRDARVPISQVVGIKSRHIEPGEQILNCGESGTVIAVKDDMVWVKMQGGAFLTLNTMDLERPTAVEEETVEEEKPPQSRPPSRSAEHSFADVVSQQLPSHHPDIKVNAALQAKDFTIETEFKP